MPTPDGEVADPKPPPVPYETFQKARLDLSSLKAEMKGRDTQIAEMKAKLAELEPKAKAADDHAATIEKMKSEHKAAQSEWEERFGLMGSGVTDAADQAVAKTLYGLLPDEGKPKNVGEWLATFRAEKDAPAPPKQLAHLFAQPSGEKPPPKRPNAAGDGSPPGNGAAPTAETILAAQAEFRAGRITADQLSRASGLTK